MKKDCKRIIFVTALAAMTPVTTFAKGNEILASSDTKVISERKSKNYPTGNFGRRAMKSRQTWKRSLFRRHERIF